MYRESFRVELRIRFTVLEGIESEESMNKLWEGFKTVYNEVAGGVVDKRRKMWKTGWARTQPRNSKKED